MTFTVTEQVVVDVHVLETRHLDVRRSTVLVDPDGVEVSRRPWRRSYAPGDDISDEPAWVQGVAAAAWTPAAVAEYRAWQAQREPAAAVPATRPSPRPARAKRPSATRSGTRR